jgi:mannose-1-phosphate guanylyltransferase/mannose-1-phosphate guanylyltransferase/mannose-6-phosphate isomerase
MGERQIHPVVLCGGSGTRLWPLSRALYPKQLLALASERTLLQETILRTADRERFAPPVVVGNEEHRFILAEQLRDLGVQPEALMIEPVGRNTAPAAAVAALLLCRDHPGAHMLVMPADHIIGDSGGFLEAVGHGLRASEAGKLVTFGIAPTSPHTGYGYIRRGVALPELPCCHAVGHFVEKPDAATAATWMLSGEYLWNSGIFLFPAARYLAELERTRPAIVEASRRALAAAERDLSFLRLGAAEFTASPADSIDYAVMEHCTDAVVVPVEMGWSDVGSWSSLWEISRKDDAGNATRGTVIALDVADSLLRSDGPAIAAVGVQNVVVVATKDAVLVVSRERAEEVRGIVDRLSALGRAEHLSPPVIHRPWGSYETTDRGDGFRVKRLVVNPGQKLSLQTHQHRAEHWVVVQGTARVERDGEVITLAENESAYIPSGTPHRLENPGATPLHLVEVQTGPYLEEDDIVRLDDAYGRTR